MRLVPQISYVHEIVLGLVCVVQYSAVSRASTGPCLSQYCTDVQYCSSSGSERSVASLPGPARPAHRSFAPFPLCLVTVRPSGRSSFPIVVPRVAPDKMEEIEGVAPDKVAALRTICDQWEREERDQVMSLAEKAFRLLRDIGWVTQMQLPNESVGALVLWNSCTVLFF